MRKFHKEKTVAFSNRLAYNDSILLEMRSLLPMIIHKNENVPYSDSELVEIGNLFFRNKLLLSEIANTPRDNDGLSISEYEAHTLLFIEQNPDITSAELAKMLRRDKSTISPLVYKLVTEGYITKEIDPGNRRRHLLNITPQGAKVCARHKKLDAQILRKTVGELLENCTIEEFRAFVKVTGLLNQMLAEQLDQKGSKEPIYFGC